MPFYSDIHTFVEILTLHRQSGFRFTHFFMIVNFLLRVSLNVRQAGEIRPNSEAATDLSNCNYVHYRWMGGCQMYCLSFSEKSIVFPLSFSIFINVSPILHNTIQSVCIIVIIRVNNSNVFAFIRVGTKYTHFSVLIELCIAY